MLGVVACRVEPACPPGTALDPQRARTLQALVGHPVSDPLCFGVVPELGVRDPAGRLHLHATADDRLLAARVRHLEHHAAQVDPGSGCRDRLLAEEATGWADELAHRRRLGVVDPSCPVVAAVGADAGSSAIARWLSTSTHTRAAGLRRSHARRCTMEGGARRTP